MTEPINIVLTYEETNEETNYTKMHFNNSDTYVKFIKARGKVPDGHWDNFENHKNFADFIARKENSNIDDFDWHNITASKINQYGGAGLLVSKYKGQTLNFVKAIAPNKKWYPFLFKTSVKNWTKVKENKIDYIEWIMKKYGWENKKDLYNLTNEMISSNHGSGLMNQYNRSVVALLNDVLEPPDGDKEWYPWCFKQVSLYTWDDFKNHKNYADWLYNKLNFTKMEDWYKVDQNTFRNMCGSGLILNKKYYNGSHIAFLQKVYPDYKWLPWLFKKVPQRYWKDMENRINYMKWFRDTTGIQTAEQFYELTREDFRRNNGGGLMKYYNDDYTRMIIELNPDLDFDETKFIRYKAMSKFTTFLKENNFVFTKEYKIVKGKKNGYFKADFFLIDLNIVIEIDGIQHFEKVFKWRIPPNIQRIRDNYKSKIMAEDGCRTIRILQEEIINNDKSWLTNNILQLLVKKESIDTEYIVSNLEKYGDIYKLHKNEYNLVIKEEQLYL
jgi:very-short-patch-repair endonuclease